MAMNIPLYLQRPLNYKIANNTAVIKDMFGPHNSLVIRAQIDLNRLRKTTYALLLLL
jgi:hemin uptake protein HemP